MLSALLLFLFQAGGPVASTTPASDPLAQLTILNGEWTVTSPHTMAGPGKTDSLVNHCYLTDAYYTCEQVVNGKPMALIVFTATETAGSYHTQIVLPNGYSTGRADLKIDGSHWTYLGKSTSDDGKTTTWYRTENVFTGRDRIHFEQYESNDNTSWKKTNEGDETRSSKG